VRDRVTLSLDSSGRPLYRRGIKVHRAHAPLRETTAAGILSLADYQTEKPLLDPMCGAGTFSLEAALLAKKIAPGMYRHFPFEHWPGFRPGQWRYIKKRAARRIISRDRTMIWASDKDKAACRRLENCVQANSLTDVVSVCHQNFFSLQPNRITKQPGLVVLNPPYGRRLGAGRNIEKLYKNIFAKLLKDFKGWHAALIVSGDEIAREMDLPFRSVEFRHGGLYLKLLTGKVD
jgi:putative N6-adenine-specific DNA methylase